MSLSDTDTVLIYYARRYMERTGRLPLKRDLDRDLVRTLIKFGGSADRARDVIAAWFDSTDPWYAKEGFRLATLCGVAMNRLFAQGEIEPAGGMTPEAQLARKLAIALFLRPTLEIVRGEKPLPDPRPTEETP